MAERKQWWEILRDQFASRGLLDPESERVQEAVSATPAVKRQARGLLSLDPQAESDTVLEMGLGSLPGTGQLMALRDLERARRAKDPAAAAMAASNFIPFGTLLNRFRRGPMSELDVYHGTPHRFPATKANPLGEFDSSKIGTGEGAQAYGHGVYLAESPKVAESYKKMWESGNRTDSRLTALLNQFGGDAEKAADRFMASVYNTPKVKEKMRKEVIGLLQEKQQASLYKADLPDEMIDRMLDWDKPLSEQSEAIKKAMGGRYENWKNATGQELYEALSEGLGGDKETSNWLRENSIPGIRYLDAGSRGNKGDGTRNFVVFPGEEKKVKILERK